MFTAHVHFAMMMKMRCIVQPYPILLIYIFNIENFVSWIRVLYNTPTVAVLTNGLRFDNFPLHRGNRQGDPLSPLLFDIVIEPLAQAVRHLC